MKEIEKQMRALASKRRLAIVKYLKKTRTASVGDIAEEIKLSFKATSKHLGILYVASILEKEQSGLMVLYCLAKNQHEATKHVITVL